MRQLEAEARTGDRTRVVLSASPSSAGFHEELGYRGGGEQTTRIGDAEFVHVEMTRPMETIALRACHAPRGRDCVFRFGLLDARPQERPERARSTARISPPRAGGNG